MEAEFKGKVVVGVVSSLLTTIILAVAAVIANATGLLVDQGVAQLIADDEKLPGLVAQALEGAEKLPIRGAGESFVAISPAAFHTVTAEFSVSKKSNATKQIAIPSGYVPINCQWYCSNEVGIAVWRNEQDGGMWEFSAWNDSDGNAAKVELTLVLLRSQ